MEAIKIHNKKMKALVDKEEYAPGTLRRFEVLNRHVEEFIAAKYNRTALSEINKTLDNRIAKWTFG